MLSKGIATLLVVLATLLPTSVAIGQTGDGSVVTARLGISAGDATESAPLGTSGDALRSLIPELWTAADQLGVTVDSASVGQGFWSEDGELDSEKDLDLVVTGPRDSIEALARILRPAWDQSVVFVWYPTAGSGLQANATIPLPGGATQLTDAIYQAIVAEITDGAHVRYAGADSLLFIARTSDTESDAAFYERMARLLRILNSHGVATGPITRGSADASTIAEDEDGWIGASAYRASDGANRVLATS